MTSPFSRAAQFGYSAEEMLKYLIKSNPQLGKRIEKAMTLGYGADQIVGFLNKQVESGGGAPRSKVEAVFDTNVVNQERARRHRGAIESLLDPNRLLAMAAGAGGGFMLGGPAGAVAGGAGAATAYNDLLNRYEQHKSEGGDLSLSDFIKAAGKGIMAGGAAGATARALGVGAGAVQAAGELRPSPDDIDITPGQEQQQIENAQKQLEQRQEPPQATPPIVRPQAAPEPSIQKEQARNLLKGAGMLGAMDLLSKQMSLPDVGSAIRGMLGPSRSKRLESVTGLSIEDIASAAYEAPQAKPQAPKQDIIIPPIQPTSSGLEPPQQLTPPEPQAPQELTPPPAEAAPRNSLVYEPTSPSEDITIQAVGKTLEQGTPSKPTGRKRKWDPIRALPSSNVRDVFYDPSQKYMQVLFQGGGLYEYYDVPKEDVQSVLEGQGVAKTIGQSPFRVYHPDREDGSIGAAFNDLIKGKKYDYNQIEDKDIRDKATRAVMKADRIIKASDTVDNFAHIMEKAKAKQELNAPHIVKALQEAAVDLDDEQLNGAIYDIRMEIRKYEEWRKKNPEKVGGKPTFQWTPTRMKKALKGEIGGAKRKADNPKKAAKVRRAGTKGPP